MENKIQTLTLSGNCYWCTEAIFQIVKGCITIKPGHFIFDKNSAYLGKVEAVEVTFDTSIIDIESIIDIYFLSHNATLVNWNASECLFPLNRAAIFYTNEEQKIMANMKLSIIKESSAIPVHTKILDLNCGSFKIVSDSQINFYLKNPNDGYCLSIINPQLEMLKKSKLKYLIKD